jgi:hypothetical protein
MKDLLDLASMAKARRILATMATALAALRNQNVPPSPEGGFSMSRA